jgi:membrane protein implicated in regulation of membrane protease activity
MYWWLWLVLGLLLLGLEALTPGGFYVLFFGVGALVVGTLVGLGASGPVWLQWLLFSAISVVSLLLFRPYLLRATGSRGQSDAMDTLQGELATPLDDIEPGAVGRAELRGTTWAALNHDRHVLGRGQRCRVARVDGLTLLIHAEPSPEVEA